MLEFNPNPLQRGYNLRKVLPRFLVILMVSLFTHIMLLAQANLEVQELFASKTIVTDSTGRYMEVRMSFRVNRPEQAARIYFKIGKNIGAHDVVSGTATIEMRGKKLFAIYNGTATPLSGDKVTLVWKGDKAKYAGAAYVTLQAQAATGALSGRVFCPVQQAGLPN
jgi:hypothetical protein